MPSGLSLPLSLSYYTSASSTWQCRCHRQCPSFIFHSFYLQGRPISYFIARLQRAKQGPCQAWLGPAPTSKAITKDHGGGWCEHVGVPRTTGAPGAETVWRRWEDTMANYLSRLGLGLRHRQLDSPPPRISIIWRTGDPTENASAVGQRGWFLDSQEMTIIYHGFDVKWWRSTLISWAEGFCS